jgi:predicted PurR-regulated permease PerM
MAKREEEQPMRALEDRAFLTFVIIVTLAMMWIVAPFFGAILWALVAAIVFNGVYRRILLKMPKRANLAAMLTLLLIIAIVIIPAIAIGSLLIDEALSTYGKLRSQQIDFGRAVLDVWAAIPESVRAQLDRVGLGDIKAVQTKLSTLVSGGLRIAATQAVNFGQSAFGFAMALGIMLYLTFFLIRDGKELTHRIGERMPIATQQRRDLFEKFTTVIRATIKGSIVVAMVQGLIGGVLFGLLGVDGALLWGVVMGFLSLIPALGTALIWGPVAIYLFATGAVVKGIILVVCGVLIIGMVDNVLRPILVGKDTRMPDYIVLISTLGGISVMGINGFIVGPVIAALFMAAWDIFGLDHTQKSDQT